PAAAAHAAAEVRWLQVSAGTNHTCAIRERSPGAGEGTLWCWGSNAAGRLGTGDTIARSVPTQIGKETNWFFVSVGNSHSCALRTQVLGIGGVRYCWGDNIHYKLGKG